MLFISQYFSKWISPFSSHSLTGADIITELITSRRQTWKTVSPSSSGILRNDSSRSRDTDDSIFASQSDSVSCSRLNSSICLRMSAEVWIELDSRRQTFPHRVVMEATCFLIRSESYWSVDFESSSARREIFSSCGFRTSISPAVTCWNKREDTRSSSSNREGNWADLTFAKAFRTGETSWPIADRRLSSNNPRSLCESQLGPVSSFLKWRTGMCAQTCQSFFSVYKYSRMFCKYYIALTMTSQLYQFEYATHRLSSQNSIFSS